MENNNNHSAVETVSNVKARLDTNNNNTNTNTNLDSNKEAEAEYNNNDNNNDNNEEYEEEYEEEYNEEYNNEEYDNNNEESPAKKMKSNNNNQNNTNNKNETFRRVREDQVQFSKEELKDNSFSAKARGNNDWGGKAHQILSTVRGKNFRHEKTKKKRGTYRGGTINYNVIRSVKFD